MKFDNNLKFLFTEFGVSGREEIIREKISKHVKKYVNSIETDVNGSLICKVNGTGKNKKKLMFSAHMDSIGFIVSHIDDNGFLRFCAVGGQSPAMIMHKRVKFENDVIGTIAIEKSEYIKTNFTIDKLYIDIGTNSKKETEKQISIGDMCVVWNEPAEQNGKLFSAILDDRIGCYAQIKALENMKKPYHDVYFVFSTQEEVGCRGAKTAAYKISPDLGIAVDITASGDTPNCDHFVSVGLGDGAAIKIKDNGIIVPKKVVDHLISVAEKNKIKFKREILGFGGTDASVIQSTKSGIFAGTISVPTRHAHSANEICDLGDVEECVKLITALTNVEFE